MDYEIYKTAQNRMRVNIGSVSYALLHHDGATTSADCGGEIDGRQVGFVLSGGYGEVVQAWARAAQEVGAPLRFAWRGVINSLGDHASVSPPWKPQARDVGRAVE